MNEFLIFLISISIFNVINFVWILFYSRKVNKEIILIEEKLQQLSDTIKIINK